MKKVFSKNGLLSRRRPFTEEEFYNYIKNNLSISELVSLFKALLRVSAELSEPHKFSSPKSKKNHNERDKYLDVS